MRKKKEQKKNKHCKLCETYVKNAENLILCADCVLELNTLGNQGKKLETINSYTGEQQEIVRLYFCGRRRK
jgi:hypothetical protein